MPESSVPGSEPGSEHATVPVSAGLAAALQEIEDLEKRDPKGKLDALLQATLSEAEQQSDPYAQAKVRVSLAKRAGRRGEFATMLSEAKQALTLATPLHDNNLSVDAQILIAGAAQSTGDYELATFALRDAEQRLGSEAPSERSGRVYLNLSSLLARTGDMSTATIYADKGLQLAERLDLGTLRLQFMLNRSKMPPPAGQADFERNLLLQSEALARTLERPDLLVSALLGLSGLARTGGDYDTALAQASEALALAESKNHTQLRNFALDSLSRIEEAKGSFTQAEEHIRSALALAKGSEERTYELTQRLASFLMARGRFEEAAQSFQDTLALYKALSEKQRSESLLQMQQMSRSEEQNRKLLRLEAESAQQRAQLAERRQDRLGLGIFVLGSALTLLLCFGALLHYRKKNTLARTDALASARMLAFASHEVRNPVHGIAGLSELLLRSPLTAQQQNWAETIARAADHLGRIANDFLQHARLRLGRTAEQKRATDVRQLMESTIALEAPMARAAGVLLVADVAPNIAPWVQIDPARLRQVLLNLLGNAIRYSGGNRVQLMALSEPGRIRFEVSDNGLGISEAELAKLFHPFVQGDQGQQLPGGSGLGLSICKDLVQTMGGEIEVSAEPGGGSRFSFSIHAASCAAPARVRPRPIARQTELRVMVVDDDAANLVLAVAQLEQLGHKARGFQLATPALKWFSEQHPDLVVLDYQMPQMDGVTFAREIRRIGRHSFKILAISGHDRSQSSEHNDMDGWLLKPVSLIQLAKAIDRVFNPSGSGIILPFDRIDVPPSVMLPNAAMPGQSAHDQNTPDQNRPGQTTHDQNTPDQNRHDQSVLDPTILAELRALSSNGAPLLPQLAALFVNGVSGRLDRLQAALAQRDWQDILAQSHQWRGSAAAIGALQLPKALQELELAAGEHNEAKAEAALAKVNSLAAKVRDALGAEVGI